MVLVDSLVAGPVVDHARAHEQHAGPDRPGGLEHVERADDVVLERRRRIVDRVLDRDRRGEVGDRVDAICPAPARGRVADVALLERQQSRVVAELVERRDVAGDEVVDRQDFVAQRRAARRRPSAR